MVGSWRTTRWNRHPDAERSDIMIGGRDQRLVVALSESRIRAATTLNDLPLPVHSTLLNRAFIL